MANERIDRHGQKNEEVERDPEIHDQLRTVLIRIDIKHVEINHALD